MIKDFRKTIKLKKKNRQFSFFYILQLPHTVILNSKKLTHPSVLKVGWQKIFLVHINQVIVSTKLCVLSL